MACAKRWCWPTRGSSAPDGNTFNFWRNQINAIRATWVGTHCDVYVPLASSTVFGQDADGSNTALYPDVIHPDDACAADIAAFAQPYLDGIPL
jgi:hypothetical protein